MSTVHMRDILAKKYSSKFVVNKTDEQVVAIFMRLQRNGKI